MLHGRGRDKAAVGPETLAWQARSLLRAKSGTLLLPKPGYIFEDAAGTTPATQDNLVGLINCSAGSGNYASQPTTNLKPKYRIGPVNRLLNSATLSTQGVTTAAIPYTLHFTGTGTVTLSGTSTAGPLVGTGVSDRVSLTFTPTAGTLTLTVSGSVTAAMLNTGSTAAPYVATTSAPKSNGIGPAWLETDGSDDYLVSNVALNTRPFTIVAAGMPQSVVTIIAGAYNPAENYRIYIGNNDTGKVSGAAGSSTYLTLFGANTWTNSRRVVSVVAQTGSAKLYDNGALADTEAPTYGGTPLAAYIGAANNTGVPGTHWNGAIHAVALIPAALTDSERQIVERYLANVSGVTL